MRGAVAALLIGLAVAGCTETVDPAGVTATTAATFQTVEFDQSVEARKLTDACIRAEFEGVNVLGPLTADGYQYIRAGSDSRFIKQAPKGQFVEMVRDIAVRKTNNELACTIYIRPYTRGAAVLAVAKSELLRQGWRPVTAARGKAEWFVKDGRTLSLLGWVPGQMRQYASGAEIEIGKISN